MNQYIEFNNINKYDKRKHILKEINLKLKKGKIIGLFGENGAGKTSLMKAYLELTTYNGLIKTNNHVMTKKNHKYLQNVGALIETPGSYPFMTGRKNLKVFSEYIGKKRESNIEEVIKDLDMSSFIDKKVKNYSLGMKQKLGIALSLINNPEFIILDEPLNGLDVYSVKSLINIIKKKKDEGVTFLISSHLIIEELKNIIDEIIIMKSGQIILHTDFKKFKNENSENLLINLLNNGGK
ncbi:ABC transporter ATP-binding protein [Fructilactobacillus sanfranciscensis]|uniref:ABC transporter ATP-binding protein n=1 Tax=Fructilactobacillus sanfranciscensis TaxID=1625 RepID=UPI00111A85C2|nr:ATP-binding cassette domain-containing protein [Fructilactobacillus sanfranciscensis]MVF15995.1 ATP-binding cassette domain-containing protein [Fructilactobacillus sanfranciscensis]TNK95149.1 lantibiotic ABC transporter ATP-binding protein [Fructilactobacillus sanfranciscensis]TNK97083.1 lantibiotic ABC transporter ATP-binding protein [Fructilactobacillus sanfranciscensis]